LKIRGDIRGSRCTTGVNDTGGKWKKSSSRKTLLILFGHLWVVELKVPKREIFDRSDFPDFYTIKSLRVGDFGVKIKNFFKNILEFI
jgi:hypothetical protein